MESSKTKDASRREDTSAAPDAAPAATRRPVKTIRVDDCSASIWAREFAVQGEPRTFYSVTLERSYKDRDGAWRYAKSFDPESLGAVVALCQQASEAIAALRKREDASREVKR